MGSVFVVVVTDVLLFKCDSLLIDLLCPRLEYSACKNPPIFIPPSLFLLTKASHASLLFLPPNSFFQTWLPI